jgi:EpsI family protein
VEGGAVTRQACCASVALVLIGLTALLIAADPRSVDTALRTPLDAIPQSLARWHAGPPPTSPVLTSDANAGAYVSRGYTDDGGTIWVTVDYYVKQTERHRPAARQLLFPGQGWSELQEKRVTIPLGEGSPLEANLVVMRGRDARMVVLYWYQIGARAIASDHWYRAALMYHRLVRRRADGALVRVGAPLADGDDVTTAFARQAEFIRAFHPRLLAALPE